MPVKKTIKKNRLTRTNGKTRKQVKKQKQTRKMLAGKLCSCIKKVQRRLSKGKRQPKDESTAIKICVYNVLTRKNKKLHSFRCRKDKGGAFIRLQKNKKK